MCDTLWILSETLGFILENISWITFILIYKNFKKFIIIIIIKYTTIQFGVCKIFFFFFEKSPFFQFSPRPHLLNKKYSKTVISWNIIRI